MHPSQPHVDDVPPRDQEPTDTAPPAPAARRRWRLPVLVAAIVAAAMLATLGITYLAGGFTDEGRFRAEPPACATIAPSLHLLGFAYTTRQTESNGCDLLLPRDNPRYSPAADISINYAVSTPSRGDAPAAASRELRRLAVAKSLPSLPGVGDEAYLWDQGVVLRVSNLVVAILVFPVHESTDEQIRAFAADLANRLRNS
jgi:hypothetical protein